MDTKHNVKEVAEQVINAIMTCSDVEVDEVDSTPKAFGERSVQFEMRRFVDIGVPTIRRGGPGLMRPGVARKPLGKMTYKVFIEARWEPFDD